MVMIGKIKMEGIIMSDSFKDELYKTITNITDGKVYVFDNSLDMTQYIDQLKTLIEENTVYKIAKVAFEDKYTLHLTLAVDPFKETEEEAY